MTYENSPVFGLSGEEEVLAKKVLEEDKELEEEINLLKMDIGEAKSEITRLENQIYKDEKMIKELLRRKEDKEFEQD